MRCVTWCRAPAGTRTESPRNWTTVLPCMPCSSSRRCLCLRLRYHPGSLIGSCSGGISTPCSLEICKPQNMKHDTGSETGPPFTPANKYNCYEWSNHKGTAETHSCWHLTRDPLCLEFIRRNKAASRCIYFPLEFVKQQEKRHWGKLQTASASADLCSYSNKLNTYLRSGEHYSTSFSVSEKLCILLISLHAHAYPWRHTRVHTTMVYRLKIWFNLYSGWIPPCLHKHPGRIISEHWFIINIYLPGCIKSH